MHNVSFWGGANMNKIDNCQEQDFQEAIRKKQTAIICFSKQSPRDAETVYLVHGEIVDEKEYMRVCPEVSY